MESMTDLAVLHRITLPNGLMVTLTDRTRHYFGGYWLVRLTITCPIPVTEHNLPDSIDLTSARNLLGEQVEFVNDLEKMAVPGDEKEQVISSFVKRFEASLLPFLGSDKFPPNFILKEYTRRSKNSLRGLSCFK